MTGKEESWYTKEEEEEGFGNKHRDFSDSTNTDKGHEK